MSSAERANAYGLANLVAHVRVNSLHSYNIDHQEIKVSVDAVRTPEEALAASLASQLYSRYYTNPTQVQKAVQLVDDTNLQQKFIGELVKANNSRWSWTRWRAVREEGGQVAIGSPSGKVVLPATVVDGPDEEGFGRVRTDKGSSTVQRAWYWAYGEDNVPADKPKIVRAYWAVSGEGAVPLLRTLTRALNEQRIPFQFKTLQDPQQYTRSDSAVLYLPAYAWDRASGTIARTHALLAHYLVDHTPLFAKRLERGLAVADDPGVDAQSFGSHRTALVAEAFVQAHVEGVAAEGTLEFIVRRLKALGYPLERLHLNPGTQRDYELPVLAVAGGA